MPLIRDSLTVYHMPNLNGGHTLHRCMPFDGLSEFAVSSNFQLDYMHGDYTIELWIKDFGNQYNYGDNNFIFFNYYVRLGIYQRNSFDWVTMTLPYFNDFYIPYTSIPGFNASKWNHVVLRFKAQGFKKEFIWNTQVIASQTIRSLGSGPTNVFTLGGYNIGAGNTTKNNYNGKMDEFRLYTRALSDGEIAYSYNNGNANLPMNTNGLVVWYGFENNTKNQGSAGSQYTLQLMNFLNNAAYTDRING